MDRDQDGKELASDLELVRFAVPRRVYSVSHAQYAVDRIKWLYDHRDLVQGLKFKYEPPVLRFFDGRLSAVGDWGAKLVAAFQADFGNDC
jgi:tryptophanase